MSITGSIVISVLPIGIKHSEKPFENNLEGIDPGAPKNPNILKKFLYTTLITTVIFSGIYYIVVSDHFNLREFIK
jgi:predicted secreted protein